MPREWLRWAVRFLQGTRKVTDGTPGDNQISAYLLDADVFVTADKAFAEITGVLRRDAAFAVARPHVLGSHADPLSGIEEAME